MRAAVYTRYGPPEVVQVREVEKPTPANNELLVRVRATTLTRGDSRLRGFTVDNAAEWLGMRLFIGIRGPRRRILGMELAGDVEAVGSDVQGFKVGDRVFGSTYQGFRFGAHAEYVTLPGDGMVAHIPEGVSYEEAAPIPSGGTAALVFLRNTGKVETRERVLINGASGTLGTYGVQIAKHYGAEVTGVCSARNVELVKSLGADHVIDYTSEDFTKGEGRYDLVFDAVNKSSKEKCRNILAPGGDYIGTNGPEPKIAELLYLRGLMEEGELRTVIDRRYTLDEIAEAHRYVDTGRKRGNVIVTV